MKISRPKVTLSDDTYRYSVDVSGNELWFEAPHAMNTSGNAAATALLVPAMAAGTDMVLEGPLSPDLAFNLSGPVQSILIALIPTLKRVSVTARETGTVEASGVASGFSAGIDSFSVLADYFHGNGPTVTHLLFNNVGSHGASGQKLWRERYAAVAPVAARIGLPLIGVDSNIDKFYDGFSFQRTHTMRNASIPLLLGFSKFLYASTYAYPDCLVAEGYDMARVDPFLLPLLGTENQTLISVGCEYTRVEKTLQVAEIEESYRSLDICVGQSVGNCSACWKCKRTQLTLELAGLLDRYHAVFDRSRWEALRHRYVLDLLPSRDPLLQEIAAFGLSVGGFTRKERVAATSRDLVKRVLRR